MCDEVDIDSGADAVGTANGRVRDARGRSENVNRKVSAAVAGAAVGLAGVAQAAAQTKLQDKFFGGGDSGTGDVASAGNGGVATSSANGGAVSIGDVNSGGNAGNAIGVGDTWGGGVTVDRGTVGNITDLHIQATRRDTPSFRPRAKTKPA